MANGGCKPDGSLNQSKFDEPMPWIGIYVATASLTCATAIAIDTLHAFRYKRFWFPCNFFSLNDTTLTLITISIKFSMDLNAAMPHRQDQLAKSSPTSAYTWAPVLSSHAFILLMMLILLAIVCCLSLAIPTIKSYLDVKYAQKLKLTNMECFRKNTGIREDLRKYWILAYSSSPQFVIGRSAPCTASGAFCLLNALILTEAILRSYLMPWSLTFCNGESDYKWSTTMVLISQTVAVGIGTIAPAVRWFMAINFSSSHKAKQARNRELSVEIYWIKKLLVWQLKPLDFKLFGHHGRKLVHRAKYRTSNCWGLPIVTLTSIALSLPSIDQESVKQLVSSVHEGLKYIREIENNLDEKINLKNVRRAEELVWSGVELDGKWLDVDLCEMGLKRNGIKETIKSLSDISKKRFTEYAQEHLIHSNEWFQKEEPSRWCIRMLAANSMYRICETILLSAEIETYESSERLFEKLSIMMGKIYAASFTNLQHVISKECRETGIEEREQNIRHALLLFGETEEILRILDVKKIQDLNPGQLVHMDEWQTGSVSSSTYKESNICSPSSLDISIE